MVFLFKYFMKTSDKLAREALLAKIEQRTEIPMLVLVIVMIAALIIPMVTRVSPEIELALEIVDWVIWGFFILELSVKTYLSTNRWHYLKKNWLDVLLVIVPFLRVLRVFRAARLARGARAARSLRALRLSRILIFFGKFTQEVKTIFARHGFNYLFVVFLGLIGIGTALIYHFDQGILEGADNIDKSLWLVVVNAFSGGFANIYPASPESKVVSIILMILGTIIVSYFTASLASYFTEKEQDVEQEEIKQKLDQIIKEIDKIKQNV